MGCKVADVALVSPMLQGPCQRVAYIANLALEEKKDYEEACGVRTLLSAVVSHAMRLPCLQVCFCKPAREYEGKAGGQNASGYTLTGEDQAVTAATSSRKLANGPISSA